MYYVVARGRCHLLGRGVVKSLGAPPILTGKGGVYEQTFLVGEEEGLKSILMLLGGRGHPLPLSSTALGKFRKTRAEFESVS